ncbi:beta-ketoacyl-[acyl-carrier-protein] synthase family protein [bacterium]|nr:beta-ketoacyl-[acyl-carrier-protein] synthase family protein [bacterium]
MNRVVITGLGVISPIGIGKEAFLKSLKEGKSGIGKITRFDTSKYRSHLGGEVTNFNPKDYINPVKIRRMDRDSQIAVASAILALRDADLEITSGNSPECGVILGSGFTGLETTEAFHRGLIEHGPSGVNPMLFPNTVPNAPAGHISIELGITGPNSTITQKGATGEGAIGYAYSLLRHDKAKVILTGGVDELSWILFHAYSHLGILSPLKNEDYPEGCRPFDKRRNGMVLGEGGGILALETLEHARERGARIYAEVIGYGMSSSNPGISDYDEDSEGMARTMELALEDAGIPKEKIGYISAAANSTPVLDKSETEAIKKVFGRDIPVSSLSSSVGYFNASGGLKAISACLAIENGFILPTINYREKDPFCDLDYIPNKIREKKIEAVLINGFADGGSNASLILKRFQGV